MTTEIIDDMNVDYIDGLNRCVDCGQRAGVAVLNDREGYFVHDRTGSTRCNPHDMIEWKVSNGELIRTEGGGLVKAADFDPAIHVEAPPWPDMSAVLKTADDVWDDAMSVAAAMVAAREEGEFLAIQGLAHDWKHRYDGDYYPLVIALVKTAADR